MANEFNNDLLVQLDQYLDGQLTEKEATALESRLNQEEPIRQQLNLLRSTRDTIQRHGIRQQVTGIHHEYMKQQDQPVPGIRYYLTGFAASVALLMIAYFGYTAVSLSADEFYTEKFVEYYLPLARDHAAGEPSAIDSLFMMRKFQQVIFTYQKINKPTQKDRFIAALAYQYQNQYVPSIRLLQEINEINDRQETREFSQEADYYLSMAYIKTGNYNKAMSLFDKMHDNPRHLYQKNIDALDFWKLRLLSTKE